MNKRIKKKYDMYFNFDMGGQMFGVKIWESRSLCGYKHLIHIKNNIQNIYSPQKDPLYRTFKKPRQRKIDKLNSEMFKHVCN